MTAASEGLVEAHGVSKWYGTHLRRDWLVLSLVGSRRRQSATGMWALNDVSLILERGRSLGVVGDNGAGKTTLLKILAGITRPSRGRTAVRGRLATRFGYGLAFNPYLSGRENVFLEGTLLGLTNREIGACLDDVIAFAGLDGAIDRPLWTYSSGMISRLGFAVATRVDADVLLLDEALSAGDAGFRMRSERVLLDARQQGRSLIVVSHGLSLVRRLCDDGLWLERGVVRAQGAVDEVIDAYELAAGLPTTRADEQLPQMSDGEAG